MAAITNVIMHGMWQWRKHFEAREQQKKNTKLGKMVHSQVEMGVVNNVALID